MIWLNRLLELVEDWQFLLHRDGFRSAWPEVIKAVAALPYRHLQFVVVARSLLLPLPDLKPKVTLAIRPFQAADLDFVRREHLPSEASLCARRLQLGHYGFVADYHDQPAGYGWGCTETVLEKIELKFETGDMLCTDAFTAPAFRGRGVQTTLTLARLRLFQEMGYKRAVAYIEIHNQPSLAVWRKMDSQIIDRIDFKRLGFWRQTRHFSGG